MIGHVLIVSGFSGLLELSVCKRRALAAPVGPPDFAKEGYLSLLLKSDPHSKVYCDSVTGYLKISFEIGDPHKAYFCPMP